MPKILVIDDDKEFQIAVRLALERNSFSVVSAYDPEEGIEKIKSDLSVFAL